MSDVFISYASDDRERIAPLVPLLEARGWSVWWDRNILAGESFDEVIQRAIDEAKCVLVVWSKASVGSRWVKTEAAEGDRRNVLVPAQLEPCDLPLEFRRVQTAQLMSWRSGHDHPDVQQLLSSISRILEKPEPPPKRGKQTRTVVFLSSGGTCRDPMAKVITNNLLETKTLKYPVTIRAAALGPLSGKSASYAARFVIREMYGEDLLADHEPELLTQELVHEADLILAMDESLLTTRGKTLPMEKTFLLREFFGSRGDISDPWPDGKDAATLGRYRDCANELRQVLTSNLEQLVRVLEV